MEPTAITYIGERIAIGNWGKFSVYLALAASLFSVFCYFISFKNENDKNFWRYLGRAAFWVHSVSVAAIFIILFVIIQKHYFEYQYAWQHSSMQLPVKYMISCFWEGQEGSFLLWMVWHVVIGNILIFSSRSWESPVMTIMALAQVMLTTMLLGVEFFGSKIGSSPFNLLRDTTPGPIFGRADYLQFITDGNGLNPLLQNYWMVIHPPTLFFGFAASIVPFAYAVSALWTRRYTEWIKPALPWALVGVMILGTGIIMGGFWAYESLTFGGYWAWDPVENASLIPWLILISAVHLMLIYKSTGNALYSTFLFTIFAFLLVLYATFLTRSGILGDTSVHSFTDLGMSGQLLIFLFIFFWLPTYVTIKNTVFRFSYFGVTALLLVLSFIYGASKWVFIPYGLITFFLFFFNIYKANPVKGKEEDFSSREFWMFIGALVFILSGLHVIISTSLPVYNKLADAQLALPGDAMGWYNQWQLPFAMIIAILTAISQFFKYKVTAQKFYLNNIVISLTISILLTTACLYIFNIEGKGGKLILYILFLLTSIFAIVGNVFYAVKVMKGKLGFSGASVAHIGFGLLLVGVLVSSANKKVISVNTSGVQLGENFDEKGQREHILLFKNNPQIMQNYEVTYLNDSISGVDNFFKIRFRRVDKQGKYTKEEFNLYPNSQKNPKMGLVSNPDTRHYLTHDVFTYVSSIPDKEGNKARPFTKFYSDTIKMGDTIRTNNGFVILTGKGVPAEGESPTPDGFVLAAFINIQTLYDTLTVYPQFILANGNQILSPQEIVEDAGLMVQFANILIPDSVNNKPARFVFNIAERPIIRDYVVLKAQVFPYINFVWGGTIVMVIGFLISIVRRIKEYRRERNKTADLV